MRIESLAGILAMSLAACGGSDTSETSSRSVQQPREAPASAVAAESAGALATEAKEPNAGSVEATSARNGATARTPGPSASPEAPAASPVEDPDAAAILRRAERVYADIRSMEADFVQRVTVPLLDQTQSSRGRMYHRRPDRFLMKFSDPEGDILVADGRFLWMYYPSTDPRQVIRSRLADGGGSVDLQRELLSNATRRFSATHRGVEEVAGRPADVLRLVPREPSQYRQVKIWVDRGDSMVRRFEIVEQNESVRRLELRNLKPNVELGDELFHFTPPPGAQVFDG
jgi:outer membrane lipoprotein carrier protein